MAAAIPATLFPFSSSTAPAVGRLGADEEDKLDKGGADKETPLLTVDKENRLIHRLETTAHLRRNGRFGALEDLNRRQVSSWEPYLAEIIKQGERDRRLVAAADADGAS